MQPVHESQLESHGAEIVNSSSDAGPHDEKSSALVGDEEGSALAWEKVGSAMPMAEESCERVELEHGNSPRDGADERQKEEELPMLPTSESGKKMKRTGSIIYKGRSPGVAKKKVSWDAKSVTFELETDDADACFLQKVHREEEDFSQLLAGDKVLEELRRLFMLAGPVAALNLIWFSRMFITLLFLGRMGTLQLAGGALAIMCANVTGLSLQFGLGSGIEPLCAQAYGAKRYRLMGEYLQKGILSCLLLSLPVGMLWWSSEGILIFLRQDPVIAKVAQQYLRFLIPDFIITSVLQPTRAFLRAQCITFPTMVCALIAVVLHVPINLFLVTHHKLGIAGAAISLCLTDLIFTLLLYLYAWCTGIVEACLAWDPPALLRDWNPVLSIALPSCAGICLEWWAYEAVALVSGLLPNPGPSIAAMSILENLSAYAYMTPLALSSSATTRVGNELGAGLPGAAKRATAVALSASIGVGVVTCMILAGTAGSWGHLFTADPETLALLSAGQHVLAVEKFFNTLGTVGGGILRGMAWPSIPLRANLASFYLVGLPASFFFGFQLMLGVPGFWSGLLVAQICCCSIITFFVLTSDWDLAVAQAQQLVRQSIVNRRRSGASFREETWLGTLIQKLRDAFGAAKKGVYSLVDLVEYYSDEEEDETV